MSVVPVGKLWTEGPKPVDQCEAFLWILRYAFALVGSELQQRHSGCFSGTIGAQTKSASRDASGPRKRANASEGLTTGSTPQALQHLEEPMADSHDGTDHLTRRKPIPSLKTHLRLVLPVVNPAPMDGCPECVTGRHAPIRSERDGEDGVRGWYRCWNCGHTWDCSWAVD